MEGGFKVAKENKVRNEITTGKGMSECGEMWDDDAKMRIARIFFAADKEGPTLRST